MSTFILPGASDKRKLSWYIKTRDIKKSLIELGYGESTLEELCDDFFEFKGKEDKKLSVSGHSITLSKKCTDNHHRIEVNVEGLVHV